MAHSVVTTEDNKVTLSVIDRCQHHLILVTMSKRYCVCMCVLDYDIVFSHYKHYHTVIVTCSH